VRQIGSTETPALIMTDASDRRARLRQRERAEAELRAHAEQFIMDDLARTPDQDFTLGWHVRKEFPSLDRQTVDQVIDSLKDQKRIAVYFNPAYVRTGDRAISPGKRFRLASPFPKEDRYPIPEGAQWLGGAPLS
jgi:hypothetical protein